ncbi:MAG: hypothetical protein AABX61_03390 [Nanoarchaeota archaeon]
MYTASLKYIHILKSDNPHNNPDLNNIYYLRASYFARQEGKLWPRLRKNSLLLGPFEGKKNCAIGLINRLEKENIKLIKTSLDRLLNVCGLNLFEDYSEDLKQYYGGLSHDK